MDAPDSPQPLFCLFVLVGLHYVLNALKSLLNSTTLSGFPNATIFLFDNNVTVNSATVWGTLNEASFTGYANHLLTAWTGPTDSGGNTSLLQEGTFSWTNGGAGAVTLYGWGIVLDFGGTNVLLSATNFVGGLTLGPGDSTPPIIPVLFDRSIS